MTTASDAAKAADKKAEETAASTASPDVQAAERGGISEGELHALRDDAGVNLSAGHGANLATWETSEAGKEWIKGAKDRDKEAKEGAERAHADVDKDGKTEADKKYEEVVSS